MSEPRQWWPGGRKGPNDDGWQSERISRAIRRRFYAMAIVAVALGICATCKSLDDWFLAPFLAILAALLWHTRRDVYAILPGFSIGFVVAAMASCGTDSPAAIDCGFYGGAIGRPLNAICRGFWRGGAAALGGIVAYVLTVQAILLLLFP